MYYQSFLLQSQAQNNDLREALAKIRSIATISDSVLLPEISLSMSRSQVNCLYCSGHFRIYEFLHLFYTVGVRDGQLFNYRDNRDYFIGNN